MPQEAILKPAPHHCGAGDANRNREERSPEHKLVVRQPKVRLLVRSSRDHQQCPDTAGMRLFHQNIALQSTAHVQSSALGAPFWPLTKHRLGQFCVCEKLQNRVKDENPKLTSRARDLHARRDVLTLPRQPAPSRAQEKASAAAEAESERWESAQFTCNVTWVACDAPAPAVPVTVMV